MTEPARRKQEKPLIATVMTQASCPGCGVATTERGVPCESCKHKPQFQAPKATIEVGAQPMPAYQRPGVSPHFGPVPTREEDA
jgi:hypothetical protein